MADSAIAAWSLHTFVDVDLTCLTLRGRRKIVIENFATLSSRGIDWWPGTCTDRSLVVLKLLPFCPG